MNVFYYAPYHVEQQEFQPGYFKLANVNQVSDAAQAERFVLPTDIRHVSDEQLLTLPYLQNNAQRHVFFSLGENPTRALPIKEAIAFRTDHNKTLCDKNPNSRAWPWPVEDLKHYMALPDTGFDFDVHAQMWKSTPLTDITVESCLQENLVVHDQRNSFFYGTLESANDPRLASLRSTFLETMQRSALVLVPRSRAGINRYRFYEALSMGRVPVLLCDDCVLPFADHDAWRDCILRIHEADAHLTGVYLKEYLLTHSDDDLIERGRIGRQLWESYLASDVWEQRWAIEVAKE